MDDFGIHDDVPVEERPWNGNAKQQGADIRDDAPWFTTTEPDEEGCFDVTVPLTLTSSDFERLWMEFKQRGNGWTAVKCEGWRDAVPAERRQFSCWLTEWTMRRTGVEASSVYKMTEPAHWAADDERAAFKIHTAKDAKFEGFDTEAAVRFADDVQHAMSGFAPDDVYALSKSIYTALHRRGVL